MFSCEFNAVNEIMKLKWHRQYVTSVVGYKNVLMEKGRIFKVLELLLTFILMLLMLLLLLHLFCSTLQWSIMYVFSMQWEAHFSFASLLTYLHPGE